MPTNLWLENQLDFTQNSSYFSLSFRHWDCTANGWELWGLNLQFNIQSRLAIFSKWSTIHITGFLAKVFESAAADKWPKVTRRMTRRITWSWWAGAGHNGTCTAFNRVDRDNTRSCTRSRGATGKAGSGKRDGNGTGTGNGTGSGTGAIPNN